MILARLDALGTRARDVLTAASVLGREVALPLLERLVGSDPRREADELVRSGLFERDGQPDELWFSHALIQEVAYGSLLKRRRRELHAAAAAAIEDLWPARIDEYLGLVAHHHRGAGDLEAARRWHDLAAERAQRLHAGDEALVHLTASIELAVELGKTVADLDVAERLLARARVRARTGDVTGARDDLERVLAEPEAAPQIAMRAHDELGFVLAGAADYRLAVTHLEAALEAAETLGDADGEVGALSRLSIVHANRLEFDAALAFGERALRSSEALHDEHAEAMAMDALKQVALQIGDFETQERMATRLAEIHRRNDDLWLLQFAVEELAYADLARVRLDRRVRRARGVARDQPADRRHRQRTDVPRDPRPRPSRPRRLRRGAGGRPAGVRPRPRARARRVDRVGGGVARVDAGRAPCLRRGGRAARGGR